MKRTKLVVTSLLSAAMMLSSSLTAGAVNITVDGNAKEYSAYRLLDLTVSLKTDDTHEDGEHTADCYNYAYTLNEKYADALKTAIGEDADVDPKDGELSEQEVIRYIEQQNEPDAIRKFADDVYGAVKDLEADCVSETKILTVGEQGYYLIVESRSDDDPDSVSLVMLDTAGAEDIKVDSKEDTPSLTKKVKRDGDEAWVDAVDTGVNETVNFQLTGTVPSNIGNYKSYYYAFHDEMCDGLQIVEDSVVVFVDGETLESENYTLSYDAEDDCTFEVTIDNLLGLENEITEETSVVVEYSATVVEGAVQGNTGNPNESYLEFSNDPYIVASHSSTVKDTVKVFQFTVEIDKIDKKGDPLTGAGFTLYAEVITEAEEEGEDPVTTWVEVGTASVNDATTEFTFAGLAQGNYKLVETQVPDGYNKADDVYFTIESAYETESDDPVITELKVLQNGAVVSEGENAKFTVSDNLGTVTGSVVNTTGIRLPHTGEFGRVILLYGGIVMMTVAAVVVVVALRKKDEEETA